MTRDQNNEPKKTGKGPPDKKKKGKRGEVIMEVPRSLK